MGTINSSRCVALALVALTLTAVLPAWEGSELNRRWEAQARRAGTALAVHGTRWVVRGTTAVALALAHAAASLAVAFADREVRAPSPAGLRTSWASSDCGAPKKQWRPAPPRG
jgi:hypothetical protein